MGRVTGKKITKIISLGKKKPSTDEQTSSAEEDVSTCGERLQCHFDIITIQTLGVGKINISLKEVS